MLSFLHLHQRIYLACQRGGHASPLPHSISAMPLCFVSQSCEQNQQIQLILLPFVVEFASATYQILKMPLRIEKRHISFIALETERWPFQEPSDGSSSQTHTRFACSISDRRFEMHFKSTGLKKQEERLSISHIKHASCSIIYLMNVRLFCLCAQWNIQLVSRVDFFKHHS